MLASVLSMSTTLSATRDKWMSSGSWNEAAIQKRGGLTGQREKNDREQAKIAEVLKEK